MLISCCYHVKVITALCIQDPELSKYQMKPEEWQQIERMLHFLQPFAEVTTHMSAQSYPTVSSIIVFFNGIMDHLDSCKHKGIYRKSGHLKVIAEAAESAYLKMKEYYNMTSSLHCVMTLLDPRCNMEYFSKKAKFADAQIKPFLQR